MFFSQFFLCSIFSSFIFISACGCGNSADDKKHNDVDITTGVNTEITDDELIDLAIRTGDASKLPQTAAPLLSRINKLIANTQLENDSVLQAIYATDAIEYNPGRRSQLFAFKQHKGVYPLIRGNKGLNLAVAVEINGQRNAAFGTNLIRDLQGSHQLAYQNHFKRLLNWLLKRDDISIQNVAQVRLALMNNYTASRTTSWLKTHYANWQVTFCNDATVLKSCLADADLVITGSDENASADQVMAGLKNAQSKGAALLYVHQHRWGSKALTNTVLAPMNLSMEPLGGAGNYFSQDSASWDNLQQMLAGRNGLEDLRQLFSKLQDNSFTFDLAACATDCDASFAEEYLNVVKKLRSLIQNLDQNKIDIFASDTYQLEQLIVLLGDFYRQTIIYPMGVTTTDNVAFLQAYFADHTVYNSRTKNQTQADLGNFSRSDFTHVTPVNKRLSYTSKEIFRSAGVYALPGQTFSVTRNDSSDLTVAIFINTLRSSSTKEFEANKYNRPKFLQSVAIPIAPGETISLTSPYGGPVQLMFSANDLQVELDFTHIGLHPHWSSAADNAGFSAAMLAGNYDWAEVVTPNFEIHSQLEKMRTTLARDNVSNVEDLAAITEQYIHNYPHVLAGYQGPGINVVAEIHDFSRDKGWAIENLDIVKHMNADQATCGWGCSGNPYDAGWSFNPVGHGDIHEFGHGLEKRELRFSGWETHSTTNTYVYYSQTQYAKETGIVECKSLPFDSLFETLKASIKETDPEAYMRAQSLNSWDQSVAMTIQMMMAAQAEGSLIDGWHLLARLHILLREFKRAVHSEILWLNKRDSLGFGQYSRAAAKALDKNDWLVIAISAATELDYREFLAMWGLSFSDTAATQVANLGFSAVTKKFYQVKDGGYCEGLDKAAITIIDTDGDGYLDFDDAFPDDATEHADVDADGIGDNVDTEYNPDASQLNYRDVHIKSLINNKCLGFITDSATIGAQAMALDCNSASEQKWSWDKQGRLHSGSSPEYCLAASSHKRGGKLRLAQCDDRENQQWIMNEADQTIQALNQKNAYFVQNRAAEVNLWSFHGERNQQWMIVPW